MNQLNALHLPKLKQQQRLTLEYGNAGKAKAFTRSTTKHSWSVSIPATEKMPPDTLKKLHINFAHEGNLYTCRSQIRDTDQQGRKIQLTPPQLLDVRPLRRDQRIETYLSTSVIIMGNHQQQHEFLYRADNQLLNISDTGALLACREALPDQVSDILLLIGLNPDNAYDSNQQIFIRCKVVRIASDIAEAIFPFCYGLQFNWLVPEFRKMLAEAINLPPHSNDIA